MSQLLHLIVKLQKAYLFQVSVRILLVVLMILGAFVATKTLEFPPGVSINDKIIHIVVFFGFSVLMDLLDEAKAFCLWKVCLLLVYGVSIEILQYFTPFRYFSVADIFADLCGIFLYILCRLVFVFLMKKTFKDC